MCSAGGQHPDFIQIAQGTTKEINKFPARITQTSAGRISGQVLACTPGCAMSRRDCTDECKMSPAMGAPEKAGPGKECQERTVGKLLMTAEMTLLGCKKKGKSEDVGLGQKWLSLDIWGLECGVQGGPAELARFRARGWEGAQWHG